MNEFQLEQTLADVVASVANVPIPSGLAARLKAKTFQPPTANPAALTFATLDRLAASGQTRRTAVGALALHAAVLLLAIFEMRALHARMDAPLQVEGEVLLNAPPPLLPPRTTAAAGGGGHAGTTPVTSGNLPKAADQQLVPIDQPPVLQPKLAVEPTVLLQQDLHMAQAVIPQFGQPNSPLVGTSLGNGHGTGVGLGYGAGIGTGSGGDTGGGLHRIGGGISAPEILFEPTPEFSEEARRQKLSGNVLVYLQVDEHGRPTHIRILRGLGMGLDEKALEAVRQYRFKPATQNGHPVAVEMNVDVVFQIL
jgi:protein TonB